VDKEKLTYTGLAHKWFFSYIFGQFAEAGNKRSKTVHLLHKCVINMIRLLIPVFDWLIIMIGPGGLLLVVPTSLRFSFMGGAIKN
jgi:hypothetical protein